MKPLLTLNGVPPQVVGSLAECSNSIRELAGPYGEHVRWSDVGEVDPVAHAVIHPFVRVSCTVLDVFQQFGASIENVCIFRMHKHELGAGMTTFMQDANLHSDESHALKELKTHNKLALRLLCVSSMPADFIDLTARKNIAAILDKHDISEDMKNRQYRQRMLQYYKHCVVQPAEWDVVLFDGSTPHNPKLAMDPHTRILQHAWVEMKLPDDWRARVKAGDGPRLAVPDLA